MQLTKEKKRSGCKNSWSRAGEYQPAGQIQGREVRISASGSQPLGRDDGHRHHRPGSVLQGRVPEKHICGLQHLLFAPTFKVIAFICTLTLSQTLAVNWHSILLSERLP
jgi:hypothetical protein